MNVRPVATTPPWARAAAAGVAACAWAGLAVQLEAVIGRVASPGAALWVMVGYFTVLTNLLVAVVFTGIAAGRAAFAAPRLVGGVTLAIVLVGVVYHLLLRGLLELSGGDQIADALMHTVTPLAAPTYWLAVAPKGGLSRRDPLLWAAYPLVYFGYALLRGAATGRYAYPFLDVSVRGWPSTLATAVAIAVGFLAVGRAMVWLDGRLGRAMQGPFSPPALR